MPVINIGFARYKIVDNSQVCRKGCCDGIPETIRRKTLKFRYFWMEYFIRGIRDLSRDWS